MQDFDALCNEAFPNCTPAEWWEYMIYEQLLADRYEELRKFHETVWTLRVECGRYARQPRDAITALNNLREKLDLLADNLRLARDRAKQESDSF